MKGLLEKAIELGFKAKTVSTLHAVRVTIEEEVGLENDMCLLLLLHEVQAWLREDHGIVVSIDDNDNGEYFISVMKLGMYGRFKSWEEALERGLLDAVELF